MSSRRHGGKVVSDLSKAILYLLKRTSNLSTAQIVSDLGEHFGEQDLRKRIYSLTYHGSISRSAAKRFSITPKGIEALANLTFEPLPAVKQWDRHWRLVIYDIPETKRIARNHIRLLLKSLGFRQLQISVWAHPMPCLNQFRDIQKAYGIEHHILLLEVKDSKDFISLKRTFSKHYPSLNVH